MPEIGASHKITHQDGGNDEISLTGLSGLAGDSQTPLAHKTSHEDGGSDEISVAGLAGQVVFVPYNDKMADITHADTSKHTLDLAVALAESRKIIAINIKPYRISGTGNLLLYPNEGTNNYYTTSGGNPPFCVIKDGTNRLQYSQSVANDDWDLYCLGYVVESA